MSDNHHQLKRERARGTQAGGLSKQEPSCTPRHTNAIIRDDLRRALLFSVAQLYERYVTSTHHVCNEVSPTVCSQLRRLCPYTVEDYWRHASSLFDIINLVVIMWESGDTNSHSHREWTNVSCYCVWCVLWQCVWVSVALHARVSVWDAWRRQEVKDEDGNSKISWASIKRSKALDMWHVFSCVLCLSLRLS